MSNYTGEYRLGLATMASCPESTEEQIRIFHKVGWQGFFTDWEIEKTADIARLARELNMEYQSIHSPFYEMNLVWREGEDGDRVTNMLIDCINDCAQNEIPVMVIHPYIGFDFENYIPTAIGIERFGKMIRYAEECGVKLGFENIEGEPFLEAIMTEFHNSPALGFCLDTGHEQCYNRGKDMLALYGDKLCHTHFNDNLGSLGKDITWLDDLHYTMGDGIVDWKNVMTRIRKTGYSGIIMCELTRLGREGHPPYERYSKMTTEEFARFALERAQMVVRM
jgi:sugar phosphate isomerase/epimerase